MQTDDVEQAWRTDGFAILPGYLSPDDLAPALDELSLCFPTAAGFHECSDPRRQRFIGDEFAGIDTFPFASAQLSLLAVHARIVDSTSHRGWERMGCDGRVDQNPRSR